MSGCFTLLVTFHVSLLSPVNRSIVEHAKETEQDRTMMMCKDQFEEKASLVVELINKLRSLASKLMQMKRMIDDNDSELKMVRSSECVQCGYDGTE